MDLGDFQSLVSQTLNRGTTLDTRIPQRIRQAVQWIERNYTFKYMEQFKLLQIVSGQRTVDLPKTQIKAWKFVRLIQDDGSYRYLNKIEPEDVLGVGIPLPGGSLGTNAGGQIGGSLSNQPMRPLLQAFWIVSNSLMVLNTVPLSNWNGEGMWYAYTDWPSDLSTTHPLIDMASDVLLSQTLLFVAAFDLRDQRMIAGWKEIRDEGINTLTRAEDEAKFGGESISMAYIPEPSGGLVDPKRN